MLLADVLNQPQATDTHLLFTKYIEKWYVLCTPIHMHVLWDIGEVYLPYLFRFWHFQEWHFQKCHFQKKILSDLLDELANFKQKKILHFWFLHQSIEIGYYLHKERLRSSIFRLIKLAE